MAQVSAQQYADILTLYALYNHASNAGDDAAFAACFTEDAILTNRAAGYHYVGQAQIAEFKRKDALRRGGLYRRHWNNSIVLQALPDGSVRSRAYLLVYTGMPGRLPTLADASVYEDHLVDPDGWKFARREVVKDAGTFRAPT